MQIYHGQFTNSRTKHYAIVRPDGKFVTKKNGMNPAIQNIRIFKTLKGAQDYIKAQYDNA